MVRYSFSALLLLGLSWQIGWSQDPEPVPTPPPAIQLDEETESPDLPPVEPPAEEPAPLEELVPPEPVPPTTPEPVPAEPVPTEPAPPEPAPPEPAPLEPVPPTTPEPIPTEPAPPEPAPTEPVPPTTPEPLPVEPVPPVPAPEPEPPVPAQPVPPQPEPPVPVQPEPQPPVPANPEPPAPTPVAPQPPGPKTAYTDPLNADADFPFVGEYVGKVTTPEGQVNTIGLQVVALGDGNFLATQYPGGLPGAGWDGTPRLSFTGLRNPESNIVTLTSAPFEILVEPDGTASVAEGNDLLGSLYKVERTSPTLGLKAPSYAYTLFDGSNTEYFNNAEMTPDGLLMEGAEFKHTFDNYRLHLEFLLPYMPYARGQARANSGVYLQRRYEVQILDSFGLNGEFNECGALYRYLPPSVNMCYPPLRWQTYDIDYQPPVFDGSGNKIRDAWLTVWHNGVLIHDAQNIEHKTGAGKPEAPNPLPILLQNHGDPVRFRNIWMIDYDSQIQPPVPVQTWGAPVAIPANWAPAGVIVSPHATVPALPVAPIVPAFPAPVVPVTVPSPPVAPVGPAAPVAPVVPVLPLPAQPADEEASAEDNTVGVDTEEPVAPAAPKVEVIVPANPGTSQGVKVVPATPMTPQTVVPAAPVAVAPAPINTSWMGAFPIWNFMDYGPGYYGFSYGYGYPWGTYAGTPYAIGQPYSWDFLNRNTYLRGHDHFHTYGTMSPYGYPQSYGYINGSSNLAAPGCANGEHGVYNGRLYDYSYHAPRHHWERIFFPY